jgi:hypothetical protein
MRVRMYLALVGVDVIAILVGVLLLVLGVSGQVGADTYFGRFSGEVGAVAVILGIVLMALGVLI